MLYWMNYFVASVRDSNSAFVDEERFAAASIVQIADSACAVNASVEFVLPCLYFEGNNVSYSLSATGSDGVLSVFAEREGLPSVSKTAACNFSGVSVRAACVFSGGERVAGTVCVNSSFSGAGGVRKVGVWSGGCKR